MWWNNFFLVLIMIIAILFMLTIIVMYCAMYIGDLWNIRANGYIYKGYDFSTPESDAYYGLLPSMNKVIEKDNEQKNKEVDEKMQ